MPSDTTVAGLAQQIAGLAPAPNRRLVAVCGPPASGKSTWARALATELCDGGCSAVVVPMDGFHLDDRLLEADGTRDRKGAPNTFDTGGLLRLVTALQSPDEVIYPVFDRSRELAIAGAGRVAASCGTVLIEGNYLLLKQNPWAQLHRAWTLSIALHPPREVLTKRLLQRWEDHGKTRAEAEAWIAGNDMPNIDTVLSLSARADITLTETPL